MLLLPNQPVKAMHEPGKVTAKVTVLANSSKEELDRGRAFATLEVPGRSKRERRRLTMSMRPQEISPVPEETARVARAANPKGNVYMSMRDELGSIYQDQMFVALFARRGQPAEAPWRLALVTVMQYMEGLSDRQATEAVRERIDWKYVLLRRVARGDIPGAARKNEKGGS
jgi:hypothetical protein